MRTTTLNKRKVTFHILLRVVVIAATIYLLLGVLLGRVLLFAENDILLNIFASIFSISTVTCGVLLIRSCNHFLGFGLDENENQTKWYSKAKALVFEVITGKHLFSYIKEGCPETKTLCFYQPYEIVYDREGELVTGISTFWYNYNRSIVFWLTGTDYPSGKWG